MQAGTASNCTDASPKLYQLPTLDFAFWPPRIDSIEQRVGSNAPFVTCCCFVVRDWEERCASTPPVRRQAPTEEVETRDLLDRILDKGLFLGSANMLLLGETNFSSSRDRFTVNPPAAAHGSPEHTRRSRTVHRRK